MYSSLQTYQPEMATIALPKNHAHLMSPQTDIINEHHYPRSAQHSDLEAPSSLLPSRDCRRRNRDD